MLQREEATADDRQQERDYSELDSQLVASGL